MLKFLLANLESAKSATISVADPNSFVSAASRSEFFLKKVPVTIFLNICEDLGWKAGRRAYLRAYGKRAQNCLH